MLFCAAIILHMFAYRNFRLVQSRGSNSDNNGPYAVYDWSIYKKPLGLFHSRAFRYIIDCQTTPNTSWNTGPWNGMQESTDDKLEPGDKRQYILLAAVCFTYVLCRSSYCVPDCVHVACIRRVLCALYVCGVVCVLSFRLLLSSSS